jgi:hypothetical protein
MTPAKKERIERFFAENAEHLKELDWQLPTGEALREAVAGARERMKTKKEEEKTAAQRTLESAMKQPEILLPRQPQEPSISSHPARDDAGEMANNAGETSPHKAAQGETRQENFAEDETTKQSENS